MWQIVIGLQALTKQNQNNIHFLCLSCPLLMFVFRLRLFTQRVWLRCRVRFVHGLQYLSSGNVHFYSLLKDGQYVLCGFDAVNT